MVETFDNGCSGSVTVRLHCGRIQFRRKTVKDSAINISAVFTKRPLRRAFTNDTTEVHLSYEIEGLRINGCDLNSSKLNFVRQDIISSSIVWEIYFSPTNYEDDIDKMAEWPKYFRLLNAQTLTDNDNIVFGSVLIVTKDIGCYLFFLKEKRVSVQLSLLKILQSLYNDRNNARKQSSVTGIGYLEHRNYQDDAVLACPFNDEGEWGAEVTRCIIDRIPSFGEFRFDLRIRKNLTWSNHLSQYFLAPALFPNTVWLFSHRNGSMLLLAHQAADIVPNSRRELSIFNLDDRLPDPKFIQQSFIDMSRVIVKDHFKDWLGSTATFWQSEGDCFQKWISIVSVTLKVVTDVISAIEAQPFTPVFLLANQRSFSLVVGALVQLCLSFPSRQSVESFNRVIQKYFVSLGFPFRLDDNKPNWLFVLFLDCTHQLIAQNRSSFVFSQCYLRHLAASFLTDYFFEFSYSSPSSRIDACRRDKGRFRWFFPVEKHFPMDVLKTFINPGYIPKKIVHETQHIDKRHELVKPIAYFPFNMEIANLEEDPQPPRAHSANDLDRVEKVDKLELKTKDSMTKRMSRVLAPKNLFNQRPAQSLILYKPLILRKAATNQKLPSPFAIFNRKPDDPVLRPRFQLPCLRFWGNFILSSEFDFDSYFTTLQFP